MTAYARHPKKIFSQAGFTLVELLMALVVAALAMSAILVASMGQHHSYNTQLQIADARQKARSVIAMLRSDLLMATSFNIATAQHIQLVEVDNNGANTTIDYNLNGAALMRGQGADAATAGAAQVVFAEDIDGLEFYFPKGVMQLNNIPIVTISLVTRAGAPDPRFQDRDIYKTKSGQPWQQPGMANANANQPLNDNFHRRFWQETVVCRNMAQ